GGGELFADAVLVHGFAFTRRRALGSGTQKARRANSRARWCAKVGGWLTSESSAAGRLDPGTGTAGTTTEPAIDDHVYHITIIAAKRAAVKLLCNFFAAHALRRLSTPCRRARYGGVASHLSSTNCRAYLQAKQRRERVQGK